MTAPRLASLPDWPARMRVDTAAAYVDAPSIEVFRSHVRRGLYPKPYKRDGEEQAWLKVELDKVLARMAGMELEPEDDFE